MSLSRERLRCKRQRAARPGASPSGCVASKGRKRTPAGGLQGIQIRHLNGCGTLVTPHSSLFTGGTRVSRLYDWLDSRLKLKSVERTLLDEPIPGGASWIYVFGSATLFLFVLQAVTGMFLAVYYAPTPDHAYDSVQYIENQVPFVGDFLVKVLRGGETLGALTLSRFFAVHVLFLPALILAGIMLHLFILRRVGPAGPWDEAKAAAGSETFYPRQVYMDAVVMLGVFIVLAALATLVPFPLTDKADPSDTSFVPVPEWYFLFYYEFLKHVHGPLEPVATWILPGAAVLVMLFWPFLDWQKKVRAPASRPLGMAL